MRTDDKLEIASIFAGILTKISDSEPKLSRHEQREPEMAQDVQTFYPTKQINQDHWGRPSSADGSSCSLIPSVDNDHGKVMDANSNTIASILEKLNDPQKKLNRRERRALQRELEMAKGVWKPYPTSDPCANQSTLSGDSLSHCILQETISERDTLMRNSQIPIRALCKRPSSSSVEDNAVVHKIRAQEPVAENRESVFRLNNVSMTPHDCVVTAFHCARISYVSTSIPVNNFLKLCRFSPSGIYIGTTSADNWARIFELNGEHKLSLVTKIPLGDAIYDIKWLPNGAEKQFLASTAKHHPIHLWTECGMRYSSYRGINHLDELTAAYSIAFSNDGSRLYAGYNSYIRIWDTDRPGRQHTSIKTWGKQTGGQKSIVSCIAMNKAFDGVYAAGTYDGNVGFYSDRTNSLECMFSTESIGITDIHYSYDGQCLFIAKRKKNEISCYDMRIPGKLLSKMLRPFTTNQRTCFEVDSAGRYLFSGSSEGNLVIFDLGCEAAEKLPVFSKEVAECSVPCVSIHEGKQPMVALCTGERVFPSPLLGRSSSSDSDSDDNRTYRSRRFDEELNNSLQLWCF